MKVITLLAFLSAIDAASGESQNDIEPSRQRAKEIADHLAAVQALPIPLPKTTPYDHDPKLRQAYFDGYIGSYRMVLAGVYYIVPSRGKPRPYLDGWRDGGEQASKDHPDKADEVFRFRMGGRQRQAK
jgi:hypothetical protein